MLLLAFLYVGEAVQLHKIPKNNLISRVNFLIMFGIDMVLGVFCWVLLAKLRVLTLAG